MKKRFHVLLLLLGAFCAGQLEALEVNYWPVFTGQKDDETGLYHSWQGAGPFIFGRTTERFDVFGVRPLWVRFEDRERNRNSVHILYPLFNYRSAPEGVAWDVFNSLRFSSFTPEARDPSRTLHLFPFLFLRLDPDPDRQYFGIFPIAGQVQNQLGYERITWFLFPLNARLERGGTTTVAMPWPFIRFMHGEGARGYHIWPLYGYARQEGRYERHYWLWPLGYHVRNELWKEEPFEAFGFLPFYARSSSDRAVSESFVWPFFGYTDSRAPEYYETRYFWPFLVQRRGESYVNRWAPVYTHSVRSGVEKRWYMWPIYREEKKIERDLLHEKQQVLFFLYWNLRQSVPGHPEVAPAIKRHLWPFFSYWDNGAGRKQLQVLSPFEVFFPQNDIVRMTYSPLFAVYKRDHEENVRTRHSVLFDFITWDRQDEAFQLHVGPLFRYERQPENRAWEVIRGLVSFDSGDDQRRFRLFWRNRGNTRSEEEPAVSTSDDAPDAAQTSEPDQVSSQP
jgi:hypothetical protein